MIKTYHSKIGIALTSIIAVALLSSVVSIILSNQWILLLIFLPVIAFVAHIFLNTQYQINHTQLIVKSGFIVNKKIEINSIKKIVETNNPRSSPALSLDRIELFYNKFDSIIISPKDKTNFINDIKNINPAIEVILRG